MPAVGEACLTSSLSVFCCVSAKVSVIGVSEGGYSVNCQFRGTFQGGPLDERPITADMYKERCQEHDGLQLHTQLKARSEAP